jgi:hypothetical protein
VEIPGTHILLRNEKRDPDEEDLFRWLSLEEWSYYDEPDKPLSRSSTAGATPMLCFCDNGARGLPWPRNASENRHLCLAVCLQMVASMIHA